MIFSLKDTLDKKHPLFTLEDKIAWQQFEEVFSSLYCSDNGRPALPIRLMVGLLILKLKRNISDVRTILRKNPKPFNDKTLTNYKQNKLKKQFQRRAAIEPMIGHLKSDHRMRHNFYKVIKGDTINVTLSATAFNFKRMMKKWKSSFYCFFIITLFCLIFLFSIKFFTPKEKFLFLRVD